MDGGDHGQSLLDGGIDGGLDLDALVGLHPSGSGHEGADEISRQQAGRLVISKGKMRVSPGRPVLGDFRTGTRDHHSTEQAGIGKSIDLASRQIWIMGLDNASSPVDRQPNSDTGERGDLVIQAEKFLLPRANSVRSIAVLNDGNELGICEETGKLHQGSLERGWLGVVAGCRMELDEADNRVATISCRERTSSTKPAIHVIAR